jgi:HprK-related kinase A
MNLGTLAAREVLRRLAGEGLVLRIPPITLRVRSPLRAFGAQLHAMYGAYEVVDAPAFADIDVRIVAARSKRLRPLACFIVDGISPFDPFPRDHALPLLEWGVNWVFAQRMHQYLLLHSAAVERDGTAMLLPAWPGSGKSTLAASLACRGWRYLSDEFGVVVPSTLQVLPFPRPAALKNESIDVMRRFAPDAYIGPTFPRTRKGSVAHLRVPQSSVIQAREGARIGAVVFPDFQAGAPVAVRTLTQSAAFLKLAHNAFNYEVLGETAFRTVAAIVRAVPCQILRYGDLDAAHRQIDRFVREPADVAA